MPTYEVTASIRAPREIVWPVLSDVLRWPEWTPTVTRVEPLGAAELAVGARFRVFQPRLRPAVWTVIEVDRPRCFTWEARTPGMTMIAEHVLTEASDGSVRLELRFGFGGALGLLLGPTQRRLVERYLGVEAASLEARVEAGSGEESGANRDAGVGGAPEHGLPAPGIAPSYQLQNSSQTLAAGLAEYHAANPGLADLRSMSPEAQQFFRCHDAAHVVFGCSVDLDDEATVKIASMFGTTAGLGALRGYRLHESIEIYKQLRVRSALRSLAHSVVVVPRTLLRCARQHARWPWDDFDRFLEVPLREIRRELGITVAHPEATR